jgi:ATP-dependent Clp protease ATP-binding subunit ClpA
MNESTFNSIIKQDEFFEKYFHVFLISPPNDKTILRILKSNTAKIKKQLEINIPEEIYENIITLARCYLSCHSLPASAINLLDSVIVRHLNENKQSTITLANLKNMIADWNNSSIGGLRLITDDNLISCGMIFDQEIYGQPHIWPIISDCLLRSKYYLRKESGTTSLIFAGPKGVGKIKAAYLLANCLGALDDQILHIDLAKFTSKTDIEKFKEILQKPNAKQIYYPYIVCILENIELANHNILLEIENIILSGEINNFDLSNTIWILTTENDLHIKYSESFSDLVHSTENKNIQLVVQTLPGSKAYNRTIKREEITKMIEKIKSRLLKIFDANFVNSITILPFTDLSQNIFAKYLLDQLRKLAGQLRETYDIELFYNYNLHERFIELIKKSDRSISDIKKKFNHDIIQNIRGLIFSEIDKQLSSRKISLSIDDDGKIICKFVYE